MTRFDRELLDAAIEQAQRSLAQGGVPIGAALGSPEAGIVARGHNEREQRGDPTAHAETVCIRNAGRRRDWHVLTLATTLSPCVMCAGAALLYRLPRIVIGEHDNFLGEEGLLRDRGVTLVHAHDPACAELLRRWIEAFGEVWDEDIGVPPSERGGG